MIQELLGSAIDDRKICVSGSLLGPAVDPPLLHPSSSSASPLSTSSSGHPNLRCPRCDSTNTKFCYYNNYNLTQPRHFCKTCRRYWTQGGALRNVPIGGGCRKARPNGITAGAGKSSGGGATKSKTLAGISLGVGGPSRLDCELHSSTISWAEPLNSNLLSLLRATSRSSGIVNSSSKASSILNRDPNRIADTETIRIREEGPAIGQNMVPDASLLINALNSGNLCMDPPGLCASLWKLQHQHQQREPQQEQNSLLLSEIATSGLHELQNRRFPSNHWNDHSGMVSGKVGYPSSHTHFPLSFPSATAATATTNSLEANTIRGEWDSWNANFIWADTPSGTLP